MKYFILFLLLNFTLLLAENVAIVGSYQISSEELAEEMEQIQLILN